MSALPQQAYAAALAGFREMTVHRLLALLRHRSPDHAFAIASGGEPPPPGGLLAHVLSDAEVRAAWRGSASRLTPELVWERCLELGVAVSVIGDPEHPAALADDPLPPPVLFSLGDRAVLGGRRVAIVGTRNATAAGRHVARQFGHGLAQAGVHVVSGLARGVDGHAHAGVFDAIDQLEANGRPVAVVASGLDVVYPREHRPLWQRTGQTGLLLTEAPPGSAPIAYRFPLRNRIIAGLAEIVVVVESRERGGSLITATAALERGIPVMAVPGHATSRAARGVNALLRDGSAPALDVDDILVALHLDHGQTLGLLTDRRARPRPGDVPAYRVCAARASTVGDVAERLDAPVLEVAMMLARLEQAGWLIQVDGWFEAAGSPLR
ncbi:MAG: DNA-processing protein DprA [Ilumatobacteraceae bacterium]